MNKCLAIIFSLSSFGLHAQKGNTAFKINGQLQNVKTGKIYLTVYSESGAVKDSAVIAAGKFSFTGNVKKPSTAFLTMPDHKDDNLRFYAEAGEMMIKGKGDKLKELEISGSALNTDDKKLATFLKPVKENEDKFYAAYSEATKAKNKVAIDSLDALEDAMTQYKRKFISEFVLTHSSSLRSAMAISENYGYYAEADEVEPLYNVLSTDIKNSAAGIAVKKMLDTYKTIAIGQVAPEIMQLDTTGKPSSLRSLRGQYVLVDFWASWCGPCRKENPNIVKAYQAYHTKGLEIFGVSYDNEKAAAKWKKAIVDDNLTWVQVSDLRGWENTTSEQFYIKAIPSNMLLDKEGKIIAKNLFGDKLTEKLKELMN